MRYLRRVPEDPMQNELPNKVEDIWGVRSSTDDPKSTVSNKRDLYDIYSKSKGEALDGTQYKDW